MIYTISLIDCLKSINFVYKNNIFNLNNFDYEYYAYSTNLETVDFILKTIKGIY